MISAVILTKNEEENIQKCIKSLKFCDEILIIDDNSKDKTAVIAKKEGVKVINNPLNNDFSKQRNFGLINAKNDWVLFIDADEKISESLAYEISNVVQNEKNLPKYTCYSIRRIDSMWGKKLLHGETGNIKLIRLVKKGTGNWTGNVHEVWKPKGKTGTLKNSIFHYPHKTINEFLAEINFYTDLRSKELFDKKIHAYWWSIIAYPKAKFLLNYIIKRGFMDGIEGFIFAILMSFHSFLVRGKLWILWQKI